MRVDSAGTPGYKPPLDMHGSQPNFGLVSILCNRVHESYNMNRIQHLASAGQSSVAEWSPSIVESGRFERNDRETSLAFFSPLHYERNYAYPLILWIHGPGDDERQLKRVMPLVSMRNYVAVAPRGTVAERTEEGDVAGRGFAWSQSADHIALAEHRVFAALSAARMKFNVSPARIFLAGYACGGTMALRLALNHPTVFAGAASFGGTFPSGHAPLRRIAEARRLKILLATGSDSVDYPPEYVCDHLRLFHTAAMSVCLRQYPCGDELTTAMLADMDRWIMDQILTPAAAVEDEAATRRGQ
jgi:phospholipase/carboxylesterase